AYGIMSDVFGPKLGAELTIAATDLSADALEAGFDRAISAGGFGEAAARMKELAESNYVRLADALKS
ncbi:MAG: hypothetical protein KDH16_04855, partial [Rhodocyclaceae bacterium]|nr:hypothetical protein [Rhodocyclaceae bacterium]